MHIPANVDCWYFLDVFLEPQVSVQEGDLTGSFAAEVSRHAGVAVRQRLNSAADPKASPLPPAPSGNRLTW